MQFSSLASTSIVNDFHRLSKADDSFDVYFEICTVSQLVSKHSVDGVRAEFCLAAKLKLGGRFCVFYYKLSPQ